MNRNLLTVFLLGFSSGLPLSLTGSTLQAWYTTSGINIVTIGFLTWLGQPYIYKFLWAPFMDRFVPPFHGRRRGWMLITQCCLVLTLAGMAFLQPTSSLMLLSTLALCVAFFSASQDICIDAYRTELLKPKERGLGSALGVGGYRIAMLVSGGAALLIAAQFGWSNTYLIMAALMLIGIIASWFGPEPEVHAHAPTNLQAAVVEPFREFMQRPGAIGLLLLLVCYKLADAFVGPAGLTTAFLIRGLGFSLVDVGTINKGVGLLASILGVFGGGVILARIELFRALLIFAVLQAFSILLFMLLSMVGKNYPLMITAVFAENFCLGMGIAGLVALIMSLCHPSYTATQFALLSALAAVSRVLIGPLTGVIVSHSGWTQFFVWSFLISFPGIILLILLRKRIPHTAKDSPLAAEVA